MKTCTHCSMDKPLTAFSRSARNTDGHQSWCKVCMSAYDRTHAKANRTSRVAASLRWQKRHPKRWFFMLRKTKAKQAGKLFTVEFEDIEWPVVCPVLGIRLHYGGLRGCGARDDCASLDQIRAGLGYVPGNVAVISLKANRIKNDATPEELAAVLRWFESKVRV